MKFIDVKEFLTSWGLHFDTPTWESNDIPFPQVYDRMMSDAIRVGAQLKSKNNFSYFIALETNVAYCRAHLRAENWNDLKKAWKKFNK